VQQVLQAPEVLAEQLDQQAKMVLQAQPDRREILAELQVRRERQEPLVLKVLLAEPPALQEPRVSLEPLGLPVCMDLPELLV
jgi:hypothetical protein